MGARVLQVQSGFHGKFGREDGVRRGPSFLRCQKKRKQTETHEHVVAALLAVRGSACFENCETEFRHSKCIRQGGVEVPVLWRRLANCVQWKAEEMWKARGWELAFGTDDDECLLRGTMWVNNYWLFSDDKEKLMCMVNDITVDGPGHEAQTGVAVVDEHFDAEGE